MRLDFAKQFLAHQEQHQADLGRRNAIKKIGAAGAAAAVVGTALGSGAASAEDSYVAEGGPYSDEMFDVEAAKAGAWVPSPYGAGDQRGSFNELTPERTAKAWRKVDPSKPVNTYQMGEQMYNGFPAFPSEPPRLHDMYCYVFGYDAAPGFVEGGGIQSGNTPLGTNQLTGHEERFAENFTFQIATQVDGLNHIGIGTTYYNGFQGPEIAKPLGTSALGNEHMGPVVTRGVILDIIGLKVANGDTDSYFLHNDKPVLNGDYRITVHDIEWALNRQHIWQGIGPGDVPIMNTGWTHLKDDPSVYLTAEPGIYLAEARYFADRKVALVAADTWGLETLNPDVTGTGAFVCHQELITKNGIRIGESFVCDAAIADNAYEGVIAITPENVPGATCGSSAPVFIANKGQTPHLHDGWS